MPHNTSPAKLGDIAKHIGDIAVFILEFYDKLNKILESMENDGAKVETGGIYITYSYEKEETIIDLTTIKIHYMTKHSEIRTFELAKLTINAVEEASDAYHDAIETEDDIHDVRTVKVICGWEVETCTIEGMCLLQSPRGVLIKISDNKCREIVYINYSHRTYYQNH